MTLPPSLKRSDASSPLAGLVNANNPLARLIEDTPESGIEIFHFAIYPEGEAMQAFNTSSPDVCYTHFTSAGVASRGSSQEILLEFASQIHPDDQPDLAALIGQHLERAAQGLSENEVQTFTSNRFRAGSQDSGWEWFEIRSRLTNGPDGLVIAEGLFTNVTNLMNALLTDALTLLPGRVSAEDWLNKILKNPSFSPIVLINIDLDNFRAINESFGMAAGDLVIKETADFLARQTSSPGWLARMEADEFLMVLRPEAADATDETELIRFAEKRILALQTGLLQHFTQRAELALRLTFCAGIAVCTDQTRPARQWMQLANAALTQARKKGHASVATYDESIRTIIEKRLQLEKNLEQAIHERKFELFFQPQVDNDNRWIGLEVLIRWREDNGEFIGPDLFIPIAEQTGQIREIGRWVIQATLRQMNEWQSAGLEPLPVAINLSPIQLEHDVDEERFSDWLIRLCAKHEITPGLIELELTETALRSDESRIREELISLSQAGFRLAIDDFGTGYSSLRSLQELPFDKIKLDRVFVTQLINNRKNEALAETSLMIAGRLGMKCVAEGVETNEEWEALKALGYNEYQGFRFSHPLNAQECSAGLRQNGISSSMLSKSGAGAGRR